MIGVAAFSAQDSKDVACGLRVIGFQQSSSSKGRAKSASHADPSGPVVSEKSAPFDRFRAFKASFGEVGAAKIGKIQLASAKAGPPTACALENRVAKIGAHQSNVVEQGTTQVSSAEIGPISTAPRRSMPRRSVLFRKAPLSLALGPTAPAAESNQSPPERGCCRRSEPGAGQRRPVGSCSGRCRAGRPCRARRHEGPGCPVEVRASPHHGHQPSHPEDLQAGSVPAVPVSRFSGLESAVK